MSSKFCSLDEAFAGPVMPVKKKKDKERRTDAPPDPRSQNGKPEASSSSSNFFPLPGETADTEEWNKAFTLEGSDLPAPDNSPMKKPQAPPPAQLVEPEEWATSFQMGSRPDASSQVAGRSTLWRDAPPAQLPPPSTITTDINNRLDELSRKLESFTSGSPMQSTAELFLFVAIGLVFLLAIDTLLRFATNIALATVTVAKRGGYRSMYGGRRTWTK